jgi:cytochrome P450
MTIHESFAHIRAGAQPDGFDPYPLYRAMREFAPVWQSPWGDWYLSSFAAVEKTMTDASLLRSPPGVEQAGAGGLVDIGAVIARYLRGWLLFSDQPAHAALRRTMVGIFRERDAAAVRPQVAALCRASVESIGACRADVVSAITTPLPINIISDQVGIPEADRGMIAGWAFVLREILDSGPGNDPEGAAATVARIQDYFLNLLRDETWLRNQGSERFRSLVTGFPPELVAINLSMLVLAGHETTVHVIGSMLYHAALRPDLWRRLQSNRALVPAMVAEALRYESPVQKICRWTTSPTEIEGTVVGADAPLVLLIGAAHRDPARYADPETFSLDRVNTSHLAFGRGAHLCVGRALALIEAEAVLETLLDCWQEVEVGDGGCQWHNNSSLRGPRHLDLAWRMR